jgi:HSP20 family molecular chaperone IbpA
MEISYSHFERTVTLPMALNQATLTVENRDGMLLVHVKPEAGR